MTEHDRPRTAGSGRWRRAARRAAALAATACLLAVGVGAPPVAAAAATPAAVELPTDSLSAPAAATPASSTVGPVIRSSARSQAQAAAVGTGAVTIRVNAETGLLGSRMLLSYTVSGDGGPTPTGLMIFTSTAGGSGCTTMLDAQGVARCAALLGPLDRRPSLDIRYSGDANYAAAQVRVGVAGPARANTSTSITAVTSDTATTAQVTVTVTADSWQPELRHLIQDGVVSIAYSQQADLAGGTTTQCYLTDTAPTNQQTCALTGLTPGATYHLRPSYAGGGGIIGSTGSDGRTVQPKASSTVALALSTPGSGAASAAAQFDTPVSPVITVSVPHGSPKPTGTVDYYATHGTAEQVPVCQGLTLGDATDDGTNDIYPALIEPGCTRTAPPGNSTFSATFVGDSTTDPSVSTGSTYTTLAAPTKVEVTVHDPVIAAGTTVILKPTASYTTYDGKKAAIANAVFTVNRVTTAGGTIPACEATVSCSLVAQTTDVAYNIEYLGTPHQYEDASTQLPVTVTGTGGSLVFDQLPNPLTPEAPFTLTAKITVNGAAPTGTVDFGDAKCAAVEVRGAVATCSGLVQAAGSSRTYTATYSDATAGRLTGDTTVRMRAATTTTVAQDVVPTVTGRPVPLGATVTSALGADGTRPRPVGSVVFTAIADDGTSTRLGSAAVTAGPDGSGTAAAALPSILLPFGTVSMVATYTAVDGATSGSESTPQPATVTAATTTTTLNAGSRVFTVSVRTTDDVAAAGTVTVTLDGSEVAGCVGLDLDNNGRATCSPPTPDVVGTYSYRATFPATPGYLASDDADERVIRDADAPCTGGMAAAFAALTADPSLGPLGSASVTFDGTVDTPLPASCNQATELAGTATVGVASTLVGTMPVRLDQTDGLCLLPGGTLRGVDGGWFDGDVTIADPICVTLDAAGQVSLFRSGSAGGSPRALPLIPVTGLAAAAPRFTFGPSGATLTALPSGSGTPCGLTALISAGGAFTATIGACDLPILGATVPLSRLQINGPTATGPVVYPTSGAAAASTRLLPGLSVGSVTLTPTADGLALSAAVAFGAPSKSLSGTVSTTITDLGEWAATATAAAGWQPVPNLTAAAFTGTLSYLSTRTQNYLFDLQDTGTLWPVLNGANVRNAVVRLSTTGACAATADGQARATISGTLTADVLAVPVTGCTDPSTGTFALTGTPGAPVAVTPGLTLTAPAVTLARDAAGATLTGTATGVITTRNATSSTPMSVQLTSSGALVIGAIAGLAPLGLSGSGYVGYAGAAATAAFTGATTPIPVSAGLTAQTSLGISAATARDLTALGASGMTGPRTIAAVATLSPTTDPAVSAALSMSSIAPLGLNFPNPTGVITLTKGVIGVSITGQTATGSAAPAVADLTLTAATDGLLTGPATLSNVSLLGTPATLNGALTHNAAGLQLSLTTPATDTTVQVKGKTALRLNRLVMTVDRSGMRITGSGGLLGNGDWLTVATPAPVTSLASYTLTLTGASPGFSPVDGLNVAKNSAFTGTLAYAPSAAQPITVTISTAAGLSLIADAATLAVTTLTITNAGARPASCAPGAATDGDLLVLAGGDLQMSLADKTVSTATQACFDLNQSTFLLAAQPKLPDLGIDARVKLSNAAVTLVRSFDPRTTKSTFTVQLAFDITIPDLSSTALRAAVLFKDGAFLAGVGVDSSFLGTDAVVGAEVLFASKDIPSVSTTDFGDFGTRKIKKGLTILAKLKLELPDQVQTALINANLTPPAAAGLVVEVNYGKTGLITTFEVRLEFAANPAGASLFKGDKASLTVDSAYLKLTYTTGKPFTFGVGVDATLTTPPSSCDGAGGAINLHGDLTVSSVQLVGTFSVGNWNNVFGICDLNVRFGVITLGVNAELPVLGFALTIGGLPSGIRDVLGYQQGAPLSLAVKVSASELLVDISVGTKGSTTAALKPFTVAGSPDLMVVNYANVYFSPTGAYLGKNYPAGWSVEFDGTLGGVGVHFGFGFDPATAHIWANADIDAFDLGPLHLGRTHIYFDFRPTRYGPQFAFDISASLSMNANVAFAGGNSEMVVSAGASIHLRLSTTASPWFVIGVTASFYAHSRDKIVELCWGGWDRGLIVCGWYWHDNPTININVDASLSVGSSGVSITFLGRDITIPFPSNRQALRGESPALAAPAASHRQALRGESPALAAAAADREALRGERPALAAPAVEVAGVKEQDEWVGVEPMPVPVSYAATAVLPNGQVLVGGGATSTGPVAATQIYRPDTGRWSTASPMRHARAGAAVVTLADGRILVTGGNGVNGVRHDAEIYDPAADRWTSTSTMRAPRFQSSAVLLPDGRVLVAGGDPTVAFDGSDSAEIYDPSTDSWSSTAAMGSRRTAAAAAVLPDGRVLLTGGVARGDALVSTEIYSPASGSWSNAGDTVSPHPGATAVRDPDGSVLVLGGSSYAERFDPATASWTPAALLDSAGQFGTAVSLPDGAVLNVGGLAADGPLDTVTQIGPGPSGLTSTARAALPSARSGAAGVALADGTVLIAGGRGATAELDSTVVFVPAAAQAPPAWSASGVVIPGPGALSYTGAGSLTTLAIVGLLLLVTGILVVTAGLRRRSGQRREPAVRGTVTGGTKS